MISYYNVQTQKGMHRRYANAPTADNTRAAYIRQQEEEDQRSPTQIHISARHGGSHLRNKEDIQKYYVAEISLLVSIGKQACTARTIPETITNATFLVLRSTSRPSMYEDHLIFDYDYEATRQQ